MNLRTQVAAAAPPWVRQRLAGDFRDVRVVHTGRHAMYVAVPVGSGERCLGLLSRTSSMVPCGLRTTLDDLASLTGTPRELKPGDLVSIGEGILRLGSVDVGIGRTLDLTAPRLDPTAAPQMAVRLREQLRDDLASVRSELPPEALGLLVEGDPASVTMLLGLGSGLTPVGDDVMAGWLATMWATRSDAEAVSTAVAATSSTATTLLSATLLERASTGDVLPEFGQLLLDLGRPTDDQAWDRLTTDVELLLAIGHTSGAGLLLGCLLALDHLTARSPSA